MVGLCSTLVTAPPALADVDHELVVNGDFTSAAEGWRTNKPTQLLDVVTEGGTSVAELTSTAEQHAVLNDAVNTVADTGAAGQEYVVTARVRTTTPAVSGALRVREVTQDNAIAHQSSFWLPNTDWHTVELNLTTSRDNAWLDLNVVAWNLETDQNLQVDMVSMVEGGSATPPAPAPKPDPAP
ncbi:MAG TPA: hypothetical protein VK053_21695, partial [Jiangellaceae bacterium]|nr:hypothetical protein [Jiangellaceae bacterium]